MKITKSELENIIREELILVKEEAYDCMQDYRRGGMTREEYKQCLEDAKRSMQEEDLDELFGRGEKKQSVPYADNIGFDWNDGGTSMVMSIDGNNVAQFSSQKEVKDLISQLEELLQGPMRTSG